MQCQKLQVFEVQSFGTDTATQSFCRSLVHYPVNDTLFEVAHYSAASDVAIHYCCCNDNDNGDDHRGDNDDSGDDNAADAGNNNHDNDEYYW